ncbi:unnamed protein product [Pseudo-nitzschia multistriata]|uniref:Peptidase S1 domain-containing protein n=1 Tax=Pseudo-nitzschia multistriata TaxID=183589 RepID=A0A448ZFZ2_9STRA|nr:unnamed protein product [Pseudo-nitzschia multistriata]
MPTPPRRQAMKTTLVLGLLALSSIVLCAETVAGSKRQQQRLRRGKGHRALLNENNDRTDSGTPATIPSKSMARRRTEATTSFTEWIESSHTFLTRVVDGSSSDQASIRYPWFARLGNSTDSGYSCGGALIARDLLLTSAGCGVPTEAYIGFAVQIESVANHPDGYDLMIVKVKASTPSAADPVRLNFDESYPSIDGEPLTVLGFGSSQSAAMELARNHLKAATISYVPPSACKGKDAADHGFCTTSLEGGESDACLGVSGGPIAKSGFFAATGASKTTTAGGDWSTDDLLLAVVSGAPGECGNQNNHRQSVSSHKEWIVDTGCSLSDDPPPEWNCSEQKEAGTAPLDNSVYYSGSSTEMTELPTSSPPSPYPTTAPTSFPSPRPTPMPTTEKPNPFPIPYPTYYEREPDTNVPVASYWGDDEDDDDDYYKFVCPICDNKYLVPSNPGAVVVVPVVGQRTCQELFDASLEGKIDKGGECDSVLLVASLVCSCGPPPTPSPTPSPTIATPSPTAEPTTNPTPSPTEETPSPTQSPTTKPPTRSPTPDPSFSPTPAPTTLPPTQSPTPGPTKATASPTQDPTVSPTPSPTKRSLSPPTCKSIKNASHGDYVDVSIDFVFQDGSSARSVGWFVSDPGHECFREGVTPGAYVVPTAESTVRLVRGIDYVFVLKVDTRQSGGNGGPIGSYTVQAEGEVLASNDGHLQNNDATIFTTPL